MNGLEKGIVNHGLFLKMLPWQSLLLKFGIALFIVFAVVKSAVYSQINVDAGYYLTAARMISDGKYPNIAYLEPYMPLVLYISSTVYAVLGKGACYAAFLGLNYAFIIGSAFFLARIVYRQSQNADYAWVIFALLFLIIFYSEGSLFVLEPATLFFGALATYLCLLGTNSSVFIAGFCIGLSFFCKQYGVFYAAPLGLYLLYRREYVKAVAIFGGFVLALFLFSAIHLWILKVPSENFTAFFWNATYGSRDSGSFLVKILAFSKFYAPYLAGSIAVFVLLVIRYKDALKTLAINPQEGLLLGAGLIQVLSFYFPDFFYPHYALLVVPFLFVFTSLYFYRLSQQKVGIMALYLAVSVVLVNTSLRSIAYGMNKLVRKEQLAKGQTINTYIPKGAKTYIDLDDLERFRFISQLEAPYPQKYGLSFSTNLNEEQSNELISRADYILSGRTDVKSYTLKGYVQVYVGQGFVVLKKTH